MQKNITNTAERNIKSGAEETLNMWQKNMKYCADKREILCRKVWNIVQKNFKYSTGKILNMFQKNLKYSAERNLKYVAKKTLNMLQLNMKYCAEKYEILCRGILNIVPEKI